MTVPLNDRFSGPYETTGGETVLAYDFKIVAATDLAVWRLRDDVAAQLVYGTDYTVDGVGVSTGGNVTLVEPAEADDVYTVEGASPLSRLTDFAGHQAYQAANLNAEFDRLQRQVVELEKRLDRVVSASRFVESDPFELPPFSGSPRALIYKDGKLDEATFAEVGQGPVPWLTAVPYAIGLVCVTGPPATLVSYGGAGYVCTVAHTASAASPDPAKFIQVSSGSFSGPASSVVDRVPVFSNTGGSEVAQSPVSIGASTGDTAGVRDLATSGKRVGSGRISATVSADTNNWAPTGFANAEIVDVTYNSNNLKITGISGGVAGRVIGLRNASAANTGLLMAASASSDAANRLDIGGSIQHRAGDVIWLRHNGTDWKKDGSRQKAPVRTIFSSNGTYTRTEGLAGIEVEVQGGGGGGGGANCTATTHSAGGSGGGGGGYSKKWVAAAAILATENVTVGAAGSGGSGGSGSAGGSSSFGAHASATGGGAGDAMASGTAIAKVLGGNGGSATGGDINIPGQDGVDAIRVTAALGSLITGGGGSSFLGFGQPGTGGNNTALSTGGDDGVGYGSGGCGKYICALVQSGSGGNGRAGVVIVTEHYA